MGHGRPNAQTVPLCRVIKLPLFKWNLVWLLFQEPNPFLVFQRPGLIWSPYCPYFLLVSPVNLWLISAGGEINAKRTVKRVTDIRCLSFFIRCPRVTFWKPWQQNKRGDADGLCSPLIRRNVNRERLRFRQNKQSDRASRRSALRAVSRVSAQLAISY